jgi:hypothetical protein
MNDYKNDSKYNDFPPSLSEDGKRLFTELMWWGENDPDWHGFRICPNPPKEVSIKDGKLYFGDREVDSYEYYCQQHPLLKGLVPKWFVIRHKTIDSDGKQFNRFVTGFDLMRNDDYDQYWSGGFHHFSDDKEFKSKSRTFNSIQEVITFFDDAIGEGQWVFSVEEPMSIQ